MQKPAEWSPCGRIFRHLLLLDKRQREKSLINKMTTFADDFTATEKLQETICCHRCAVNPASARRVRHCPPLVTLPSPAFPNTYRKFPSEQLEERLLSSVSSILSGLLFRCHGHGVRAAFQWLPFLPAARTPEECKATTRLMWPGETASCTCNAPIAT